MRITEAFVDQVVADIGGERIPTDDENRTVDYLIGDWLFELKDHQEEGLEQPERQSGRRRDYLLLRQPIPFNQGGIKPGRFSQRRQQGRRYRQVSERSFRRLDPHEGVRCGGSDAVLRLKGHGRDSAVKLPLNCR